MPSARLHDDCAVGLTTKLVTCTQPINVNLQVESCQELLWKFTNAKKGKSVREIEATETNEVLIAQTSTLIVCQAGVLQNIVCLWMVSSKTVRAKSVNNNVNIIF